MIENVLVDAERAREQGRLAYADRAWVDAFDALKLANQQQLLTPQDLELLAHSAYMLGRDDEYRAALEQAYQAYRDAGDSSHAARCAWWIGHSLFSSGQAAPARGWFARGQRLLQRESRESVARGYLLIPTIFEHYGKGEFAAAYATAAEIAAIGERFGDPDLVALAVMEQGHALVRQGGPRKASGSWTRRWWRSPPVSCRRSWRASSTATRSRSAATRTSFGARASGRMR